MPEAAIPLVAEEAVGATAAELAAQQAAAAAAAEQAAQMAAAQQAAAQQAAAEQATQAAAQQATTGGISDLVQPTTAPVNPAAAIQGAPLPQAGPAIPPVQSAPLQPPPGTPPAAPPPMAPPPPTAPPPPPEVISRSVGPIDSTTRMANPGFDAGGFENLSGIETLAKEVGAQTPNMQGMQGMQTMTSGYGAGALPGSSVLPPMPVGPPAAPGLPGLQTNLAGMGSNIPPTPVMPPPAAPTPDLSPPTNATPGGEQMRNVNGGQPEPYEWAQSGVPGNANLIQAAATPAATPEVGGLQGLYNDFKAMPLKDKALTGLMAASAYQMLNPPKPYEPKKYKSTFKPGLYSGYNPTPPTPYTPQYAGGGWAAIGPAVQKALEKTGLLKHKSSFDPSKYTAANTEPPNPYQPQYAHGGLADLGGYSDGGRMLKGPGDGMSDDIPATIANKQPARLANEEFVVPADVVSHLGNGSSEAGAKVLYKMMDRVRQARTGNKKQGKQINPEKYLA